jgi:hypothetical protein
LSRFFATFFLGAVIFKNRTVFTGVSSCFCGRAGMTMAQLHAMLPN